MGANCQEDNSLLFPGSEKTNYKTPFIYYYSLFFNSTQE